MKCDTAESTHLWICCQRKYCRCILTKFTNLQYGTDEENYEPLGAMIWGYPGQIQGTVGNLHNQLFVIEKIFKTKAEAPKTKSDKFLKHSRLLYFLTEEDMLTSCSPIRT